MVKSSYLCCAERARYRLGVGSTGAVLFLIQRFLLFFFNLYVAPASTIFPTWEKWSSTLFSLFLQASIALDITFWNLSHLL